MTTRTLVLLPGLDGTEVFFRPLLASLPRWIQPRVVCFPSGGSNYADLLAIVREALSDYPSFYVLGSSFAGPLALMLAEAEPEKVKGVILANADAKRQLEAVLHAENTHYRYAWERTYKPEAELLLRDLEKPRLAAP